MNNKIKRLVLSLAFTSGITSLSGTVMAQTTNATSESLALPSLIKTVDVRSLGMGSVKGLSNGGHLIYADPTSVLTQDGMVKVAYSYNGMLQTEMNGNPTLHAVTGGVKFGEKYGIVAGFRHFSSYETKVMNSFGEFEENFIPRDWSLDAAFTMSITPNISGFIGGGYARTEMGLTGNAGYGRVGATYHDFINDDENLWYKVGISAENLGAIKYTNDTHTYYTPALGVLSGELSYHLGGRHALNAAASAGMYFQNVSKRADIGVGLEYAYEGIGAVRTGYHYGMGGNNFSLGASLDIYMFQLDMAYVFATPKNFNTLSLGLSCRF